MIFSEAAAAPRAKAVKKFYKKRGRQRTAEKTKEVILFKLTKKQWPAGLSAYMQGYYNEHYIKKSGRFHEKAKLWRQETKANNTDTA